MASASGSARPSAARSAAGRLTSPAAGEIMMVSTGSPRIARACRSNCDSRCERVVTKPAPVSIGWTVAK
ncbi:Uncharacterised protein [Mycobacteroides abscessus subsp. abscessus]|nr:Uncharacterised protein [Mycobacteroides abscessus subsp. abscessus]